MSDSGSKISNKAKSVYSDYPLNRDRHLSWANETLSKLKSDRHILSKLKRNIRHMAFDSSVTGDNQKKKASNKENLANTESKKNGDSQCKLKAKHMHTVASCIEDKEGDLYQREESTEQKKKKKKYKESSHEDCSADTTRLEVPLAARLPLGKERSRKKLTQTVNSLKDKSNDKVVLTGIIVDTNKNALHSRNIKQGRTIGNFGLSPIAMLLGTELEFSNSNHSCSTCCRCKLHRKISPLESSESPAKEIGNTVIKTEPGLIIE
jgi:hypothetical protein